MSINYKCTCCKKTKDRSVFPDSFVLSEAVCSPCKILIENGETNKCNYCKRPVLFKHFNGGKTCNCCKIKQKTYRDKNKLKIKTQQKKYQDSLTDEQKKIRYQTKMSNVSNEKKEQNRERHQEYSEEYRKKNKIKINEKRKKQLNVLYANQ